MTVAETLRNYVWRAHLLDKQVAVAVRRSKSHCSRVLKGTRALKPEEVAAWARALKLSEAETAALREAVEIQAATPFVRDLVASLRARIETLERRRKR